MANIHNLLLYNTITCISRHNQYNMNFPNVEFILMGHNKETPPKKSYFNTIGCISGHSTDIMIIPHLFTKYSIFFICRWIDKWRGADLLQSPIECTKWCFETSSCYSSNVWKTLKTYFDFNLLIIQMLREMCVYGSKQEVHYQNVIL